ncbi:AAA family ATPase [Pseudomonas monsensis]
MKIEFLDIQNFRKLKSCRLELSDQETVFVGANNSGKTSAMDMLIRFLIKARRKELSTTDFTLSNWYELNKVAETWGSMSEKGGTLGEWQKLCPALDLWLDVEECEAYRVSHLIPSLDWKAGRLGVRISFEPKDISALKNEYITERTLSKRLLEEAREKSPGSTTFSIWPRNLRDFLDKPGRLHGHFKFNSYLLDPDLVDLSSEKINTQDIPNQEPLENDPFEGLLRIDLIEAQRGFSDSGNNETVGMGSTGRGSLSQQLKKYYQKHLDPSESPDLEDILALQSIDQAKSTFDDRLKERLTNALTEIETIGYPGFADPSITITSKINPIDTLDHDTAIQFDLFKKAADGLESLRLPEKMNGLGYKNLISMIFALISFRDGWMRVKKAQSLLGESIEPLHLVLIEEPEAHLHAQVQQVFINKAYTVLRNHERLKDKTDFNTQLVVSTHSSYLAYEMDFSKLRYFKRCKAVSGFETPTANIVNLRATFGDKDNETSKYVARYLKTTHCDLFFANGIVLVEGAAERMLVPHFIRSNFEKLSASYISVLEINGAHAHRLQPLIEKLGLHTLIVTDLDSKEEKKDPKDGTSSVTKALPDIGRGQVSDNTTLRKWLPKLSAIDDLMVVETKNKISSCGTTRVCYQGPIPLDVKPWKAEPPVSAVPYTFEDALALTNVETFRGHKTATGMLKKMCDALSLADLDQARAGMFSALSGEKAKMALDLLFDIDPAKLIPPLYIREGLEWLEQSLNSTSVEDAVAELAAALIVAGDEPPIPAKSKESGEVMSSTSMTWAVTERSEDK